MSKTDRQTDTKARGYQWQVTAFDPSGNQTFNERLYLESLRDRTPGIVWPSWLKEVTGGMEKCPDTGALHFQADLKTTQVRFSQIKKVFPQAHIEKVHHPESHIDYVMKSATAVGDKSNSSNPAYLDIADAMRLLINTLLEHFPSHLIEYQMRVDDKAVPKMYWRAVNLLMAKHKCWRDNPGAFTRLDFKEIWKFCWKIYLDEVVGEGHSITPSPGTQSSDENQLVTPPSTPRSTMTSESDFSNWTIRTGTGQKIRKPPA